MVRILLIIIVNILITSWGVLSQNKDLSRRDFIKMWKDYKKGELSLGSDTVYVTKTKTDTVKQLIAIEIPKERIVKVDTCLESTPTRRELKYDYRKAKLQADNQVRLASLQLKNEREARKKERSYNNFVIDSLKNALYIKKISEESMVDSLTLVTKAAVKTTRIENKTERQDGSLIQRILRTLAFFAVFAVGIFIGKNFM